ncbi:MAG: alpha/beta hydrolase, partial [Steroidobacteraceae bacterium]
WYEYHAIMPRLARQYTVIAADLRGIGGSTPTSSGYDAATMATDLHQLTQSLGLDRVYIVGHDVGGMVTYAFLRRYPQSTRGAMILDVPLPGLEGWGDMQREPGLWHVEFMQVPGLPEKLVTGRQADYFSYFFDFGKFTPADEAHYASAYAAPAQLHAMFEMYRAFPENAKFNAAQRAPVDVPLFVATGDQSPFAKLVPKMADALRASGVKKVDTGMINGSPHYVVQDQPDAVADLIERHAASAR